MTSDSKRPRGRPVKNKMPDPIPASAEDIARILLRTPPRKRAEWDYFKERHLSRSTLFRREAKKDK